MSTRILIVDDQEEMLFLMSEIISNNSPHVPIAVSSGEEALERIAQGGIDVVVTDLVMPPPKMDGVELLGKVHAINPLLPVLVVTAHGTIESAVDLMWKGAYDYITKPFQPKELLRRIDRAVETLGLKKEISQLRGQLRLQEGVKDIVGNSEGICRLLQILPEVSRTDASVVITGESGTGKELVARAVHHLSRRAGGPFVTLHCGALPETLLENELFGHARGAYSDAHADYTGLAQEAHGGTLFLDEIAEISLNVQVKLLRFLQQKEYRPLGSTKTLQSDARIVAATNKDLQEEIARGRFREDLFYRLNIIPLHLPPLRERREDVASLAIHFLKRYSDVYGKPIEGFTPAAMQRLLDYSWPGNIRELENKIQQLLVLATPPLIRPEQIRFEADASVAFSPIAPRASSHHKPFRDAKKELLGLFEREYVCTKLEEHSGHIGHASEASGLDRRSFYELMRRYGVDAKTYKKKARRIRPPAQYSSS